LSIFENTLEGERFFTTFDQGILMGGYAFTRGMSNTLLPDFVKPFAKLRLDVTSRDAIIVLRHKSKIHQRPAWELTDRVMHFSESRRWLRGGRCNPAIPPHRPVSIHEPVAPGGTIVVRESGNARYCVMRPHMR
jgi:hypothetical protein